jgi:predicted XRE-type DNA-binding protein
MTRQGELKQQLIGALKDWRSDAGLTQRDAAKCLGISQSSMGDLKRFSLGRLLDLWVKSGGDVTLKLSRRKGPHD